MIPAEQLIRTFQSNHWIARQLLDDLSHEESLLRPGFQANCMNWVLGHIVRGRNRALEHLERPGLWDEAENSRYTTGSAPITGQDGLHFEKLTADFDEAQADLELALSQAAGDFLAEIIPTRFGDQPRWQAISGLAWHETYHVGQLELLRELALARRPEPA